MHPNTTRRQTKTHKALIYTHDLQMHMRNAIVAEPLMQQLCSQKQGPREAAMVVYALVRPAFMRLMKHDPLTLLDEFILPPPRFLYRRSGATAVSRKTSRRFLSSNIMHYDPIPLRCNIVCFGVECNIRCTCFLCPCIQAKAAASIRPNLASSTMLLRSQILWPSES